MSIFQDALLQGRNALKAFRGVALLVGPANAAVTVTVTFAAAAPESLQKVVNQPLRTADTMNISRADYAGLGLGLLNITVGTVFRTVDGKTTYRVTKVNDNAADSTLISYDVEASTHA